MDARFLRPLGVGEIIDAAFKIYRARFGALVRAVAIVVVPVQILNVIVLLSLPGTTETTTRTGFGTTTTTTTTNGGAALAAFLLVSLVAFLSVFLAQAVCLKIVTDAYLGTTTGWRESLKFGLSRLHSLLWISLLVIMGAGIGFLLCILPGVWLYVSWCVAIPVLLVEGTKGTKAMSRSFRLVRSRWWPVFGTLIITVLITGIVSFALTIITVPLLLSGASESTSQVANAITSAIASVLTTPITAAVTALLYFDLRVRKEGFDVALMAQRVGIAPPPGGFPTAPSQWGSPPPATWAPPGEPWGAPPPAGVGWSPPPAQMPPPGTPPAPPGAWPPPPPGAPAPTPTPTAPWNTPPASPPPPPLPPWPSSGQPEETAEPPPPAAPDEPPADPRPDS